MLKIKDNNDTPEGYASRAEYAQYLGEYKEAIKLWRLASKSCLGHKRAARYEAQAEVVEKLLGDN